VAELFHAARRENAPQPFLTTAQMRGAGAGPRLIDANGLTFRYQAAGEPVLRGADLAIGRGERILLEGASGGGKSTLASLLAGLRDADSGLLLLNGLDRHTLGDNWHRLATEAPQFHENHVLSGSFGFNLLLGREWPAPDADLDEAEALCRELGLGPLLARMPSGMQQRVGETGWQLSHGERSRLFLARALLQKAQLTIMDESFAALDPETLAQCMACAIRHDTTLMVIAHP
jgi:ATP-binding cassette subfamily B protein